jgi:hypothetical protein
MISEEDRFIKALMIGKNGEEGVIRWLVSNGDCSFAVPIEGMGEINGCGPRYFISNSLPRVAPDIFACHKSFGHFWAEVKTKDVFTWYRKGSEWQTGIDISCLNNYKVAEKETGLKVYLFFLQWNSKPDLNSPDNCPTGLYGGWISEMKESHRWSNMVYWSKDVLILHSDLYTIIEFVPKMESEMQNWQLIRSRKLK